MKRSLAVALLLALVLGAQCNVLLMDSKGSALKEGAPTKCNQHGLATTLAALSGLVPPQTSDTVDAGAARDVVARSNVFERPRASVFVHVAGLGKEMVQQGLSAIFERKKQRTIEVESQPGSSLAATTASAFQAVAAANPDVKVRRLCRRLCNT